MRLELKECVVPERTDIVDLYRSNGWSAADKPDALMKALAGSDHLILAYRGGELIGLANAITDGHLVVYYPHLLVHSTAQGAGGGRALMSRMIERYAAMHQHLLTAVSGAVEFYETVGFTRAK